MDNVTPVRAAIYGRVSTQEQVEGTSLDSQRARCRAYIEYQSDPAHPWVIAGEYFDEGVSGAMASRPQLDAVMAAARAGEIDTIIVLKLDRFGRSARHLQNALGDLDDLGVRFVSVAESFDTSTSTGRLQRNILGSFAEFERDQIGERTVAGLKAVAAGGYWTGGPPPFGFALERGERHTRLIEDEAEAQVIRAAVDAVLDDGLSTHDTAERLNALGHHTRTGGRWTHRHVRRLLRDGYISGTWQYGRSDRGRKAKAVGEPLSVAIPPIISPERHEQVKSVLATTARSSTRTANRFYLLSRGMLTMPCGGRGYGTHRDDRGYRQYVCENKRSGLARRCDCGRIHAADLDGVVWDAVVELLAEPERLVRMAHDYLGTRGDQMRVERSQVEDVDRQIEAMERTLSDRVAEYLREGIDARTVRAAVASIEADLAALRSHRDTLQGWLEQNLDESGRMRRLWEVADMAHRRLGDMTPEEQRTVLDLLSVRVRVTGYAGCGECDGRGRVSKSRKPGGVTCPMCNGIRYVPNVEIEGRVREHVLLAVETGGEMRSQSAGEPRRSSSPVR